MKECAVERFYHDIRQSRIADGSAEIMKEIIVP